jgi:hypothetical protein
MTNWFVIPAKAGIQMQHWAPAFAGEQARARATVAR